jgi:predicted negative regulator of RcsB-dependent stress response
VEDLSDIEREEQLRRWWSENWAWIIGGIALGLALLAGWQYWQRYRVQNADRDEAAYVSVLQALSRDQREEAANQAKALRERKPGSPYADQAELALARSALERRDLDGAAALLRGVADRSKDAELRQVARMRLARVLLEQGKHDEALALLDPAAGGSFAPLLHELRGNALAAKGDVAAARKEYEAALAGPAVEGSLDREFVELKRDALPAAAATSAAAAPAVAAPGAASPATGQPAAAAPVSPAPEAPAK